MFYKEATQIIDLGTYEREFHLKSEYKITLLFTIFLRWYAILFFFSDNDAYFNIITFYICQKMPKALKLKTPKALARNATRKPKRPVTLVLENRDPGIISYPQNTWAILKPVNNLDSLHLPYIFLTEPFNCLGKFPDSDPTHHQLPLDPHINDRHCLIRIENITNFTNITSSKIILEDISDSGTMVDGVLIKRDIRNGHSNTTEIRHCSKISFPGSKVESGLYTYELDVINLRSNGKFERVYRLGRLLGKGHFSSVYIAKRLRDGCSYAVKVLEKPTISKEIQTQIKMIQSEIQILNSLAHENLIKIFEYYDEPDKIYLVIEYVEDGEFFDLFKSRFLSEDEIRTIFVQLLSAIKYLHDRKIVHRDLKPENILMPSKKGLRIKVSDFGLSKLLNIDYSTMQTRCGTVLYVAPEVLESSNVRSYNKAVDMWSTGVILYACLCGSYPFTGDNPGIIASKIRAGNYTMDSPKWKRVSETAKDLVRSLLNKDSYERLTVEEALNHPFIKYGSHIPTPLYSKIQKSKQSDELSTDDDTFFSCESHFSGVSTTGEPMSTNGELDKLSFTTASETIRSYSSSENEISSPTQAVVTNGFVYVSGQIPLEPETRKIVSDDIREQTIIGNARPARACVEMARLPLDVKIEVETIASLNP
ncbi:serine/threonine-protein kinase chk2 [Rhizophagus clarus]|uniref:Serine/threonine-protein kinase chk2 n=1 Tax=Rhizophagus clarus TaxID=94130 RepID=A0A8H3LR54_9GLOM|nr:serine/threonine-protein kinase chk2 [Rhizophagus clarus]